MADLSIMFHAMRGSKRLAPARMVQILGVRLRGAARLFHAELEDNTRTNFFLIALQPMCKYLIIH